VKELSGATKSKGIEIDITARPFEGFNVMAGYSYNDMHYTSGLVGSFIEGDRLARTPANTANMSFFYTIPSENYKDFLLELLETNIGTALRVNRYTNDVNNPGSLTTEDRKYQLVVIHNYRFERRGTVGKILNSLQIIEYN
jgi:iron complex outermembrane receptor protein